MTTPQETSASSDAEITKPRSFEENLERVRASGQVDDFCREAGITLSPRKRAALERGAARIMTAYPHLLKPRRKRK